MDIGGPNRFPYLCNKLVKYPSTDPGSVLAYNGKDNDRLESLMPNILVYLPDRIPCECEMKRRCN